MVLFKNFRTKLLAMLATNGAVRLLRNFPPVSSCRALGAVVLTFAFILSCFFYRWNGDTAVSLDIADVVLSLFFCTIKSVRGVCSICIGFRWKVTSLAFFWN